MFEFRERKERKRGEEGTGLVRGPVKCEDANESGPKPGEGSLPPRTFNLRGNLAHVDLLAAVPCALQGYRARPPPPFDRVHTPHPIRYARSHLSARLIPAERLFSPRLDLSNE